MKRVPRGKIAPLRITNRPPSIRKCPERSQVLGLVSPFRSLRVGMVSSHRAMSTTEGDLGCHAFHVAAVREADRVKPARLHRRSARHTNCRCACEAPSTRHTDLPSSRLTFGCGDRLESAPSHRPERGGARSRYSSLPQTSHWSDTPSQDAQSPFSSRRLVSPAPRVTTLPSSQR